MCCIIHIDKFRYERKGAGCMELSDKQITVIFKALCDENRVKIFRLLQGG